MALLTQDLGTTTGYKVGTKQSSVSGTFDLKPSRWEGGGMRGVKYRQKLNEMHAAFGITHVAYEIVQHSRRRDNGAAQIYGGLLMLLTSWCEENGIPYEGVTIQHIKKFFTGNGNASKEMMIAECERRGFAVQDHNEADAVALFEMKIDSVSVSSPIVTLEELEASLALPVGSLGGGLRMSSLAKPDHSELEVV